MWFQSCSKLGTVNSLDEFTTGCQAKKDAAQKKKQQNAPVAEAKSKNEIAKLVADCMGRYFAEYERRHVHLELDENGDSLFSSCVKDFLRFQEEGRSQVPMGYYKRKKRQFPGPREAFKKLAVNPDVRRDITMKLLVCGIH